MSMKILLVALAALLLSCNAFASVVPIQLWLMPGFQPIALFVAIEVDFVLLFLGQKFFANNFFERSSVKKIIALALTITLASILVDFLATIFGVYAFFLRLTGSVWINGTFLVCAFVLALITNTVIGIVFGIKPKQAFLVSLPLAAISNPYTPTFLGYYAIFAFFGLIVASPAAFFALMRAISKNREGKELKLAKNFFRILIAIGLIFIFLISFFVTPM